MNNLPYYQYNPFYDPTQYLMAQGRKRELRWTSNALCWTLLAALFLMSGLTIVCGKYLVALGYTGEYANPNFNGYTPVLYYLSYGLSYVVGLALPVMLYFAIKRIALHEILPFEKAGVLKTVACVFFGSAVCLLANFPANVVVNIQNAFGFSGATPEMPLTDDSWVLVLYGIAIAIIPPIVEELLFRGMIMQSLRKYGNGFAVIASALMFGLYHGNFVQMVFAFIAGLVMGFVVIRTGSLWASILIHFINNGISVFIQMVQRYAGEDTANTVNGIVVVSLLVLGVISLIYLLIKDKHFFSVEKPDPFLKLSSKLGAAFFNPGGIALLIFAAYSSIYTITHY